jgi:hypothetical protein
MSLGFVLDKCGIMWVFCAISSLWFMLTKCGQFVGFLDNLWVFYARMSPWFMLAKYGQFVGFLDNFRVFCARMSLWFILVKWKICVFSGQFLGFLCKNVLLVHVS